MSDLDHQWGSDLLLDSTGDIATISGAPAGQQRVMRRLLTNPLDYIWQPGYGAGLAFYVGQPIDAAGITALIRSQIFNEPAVAQTPEPVIDVASPDTASGTLSITLLYADQETADTQHLTLSPGT
jgi:hypothetical protein